MQNRNAGQGIDTADTRFNVSSSGEGAELKGFVHLLAALVLAAPAIAGAQALDGTRPLDTPLVCLARAIYFEAGGQSDREMTAVGHVVMNRVREAGFPDDVCAVIRDGGEQPPCQFSWWCDGQSDIAADRPEYDRAVRVARAILSGEVPDPTGGANMFHNRTVSPSWARRAERKAKIGDQVFYHLRKR
jgi:spore germination cell wall hydrolase CwlJ-like protein